MSKTLQGKPILNKYEEEEILIKTNPEDLPEIEALEFDLDNFEEFGGIIDRFEQFSDDYEGF